ncbi:hypothetical protein D3C84_487580 [compost metagenome]
MDLRDIIALPLVQRSLQRKVRHADHRIHGRADFVTHVCKEVAFCPRRLFSNLLRPLLRVLCCLALGDVLQPAEQPLLPLDLDWQVGDKHGAFAPLPVTHRYFLVLCDAVVREAFDDGFAIMPIRVNLRSSVTDAYAERFTEAGVGEADHALGRKGYVDWTRIEDCLQPRAFFAKRHCCRMMIRDIAHPTGDQGLTVDCHE